MTYHFDHLRQGTARRLTQSFMGAWREFPSSLGLLPWVSEVQGGREQWRKRSAGAGGDVSWSRCYYIICGRAWQSSGKSG